MISEYFISGLLIIALIFAIARFIIPVTGALNPKDIFKDMAHIFVGFLFGCAAAVTWLENASIKEIWIYWIIPVVLTAVEIVAFVVRKKS